MYNINEIVTAEDIRRADEDNGGYFFAPATMKCWRSRVSSRVYKGPGGTFFITSEKDERGPRWYSVRRVRDEIPPGCKGCVAPGAVKRCSSLAEAKDVAHLAANPPEEAANA
jgi:hypothetical protein